MAEDYQRKLPFSIEAEQSVLGSILIDPEKFNEVGSIITSEDFYLDEHKNIYLAMQDLFLQQSRKIDIITLIDTLVLRGVYDENSSREYIKLIAEVVPSASNVRDYATIVKNKSTLRKLIEITGEISESAYLEQDKVEHILDSAEQKIFSLADINEQKGFVHIKDVLLATYDRLNSLQTDKEGTLGVKTGFSGLDNVLVGMGKSDLILVGARPGMGKTSFVLNIATNVAQTTKKTVCIFSLEMSSEQLVSRIISSDAMVDSHNLRSGELTEEDWKKIAVSASKLSETDIYIDDTTGSTVTSMKAKLRRMKNLGLVVIDYLQLMQSDRKMDNNRVQEVADISRNLKILAKELSVPVICCAQLSRGPESRTDKTPMLSDLRDSGAIEQDADVVMFLYRPDYYADDPDKQNVAQVIIAKNRHGSTDKVNMCWLGQYTRFESLETNLTE